MKAIQGLILAGGHSSRMGTDKSGLNYHGIPQYLHIAQLLNPFCEKVYMSVRSSAYDDIICIQDNPELGEIGPMAGIITALEILNCPIIVIGVDYPLLKKKDLEYLIEQRQPDKLATVYFNTESGFLEPLLAIYETNILSVLKSELELGNTSLQRILNTCDIKKTLPLDLGRIISVDTPELFEKIKKEL